MAFRSRLRTGTPRGGRIDRGLPSLSDAWRAWVAENLLLGVAREDVLAMLRSNGVPRIVAMREVESIARSALMIGARKVARYVPRYELAARVRRETERLGSAPQSVDRRSDMSPEEFIDRYYATSTPVVLTDALAPWPALSRWSPTYFKDRFGAAMIEVTSGRDRDPQCDANFKAHCVTTTLGEFCDRVASAGNTNDFYLLANNRVTKNPACEALFEDVRTPHPYLDDSRTASSISIWFGPAGTVTPLHHDTANVLFCQVFGRKKILLFPPFELSLMRRMHHGVYSSIDAESPDADAFPEFAEISRKEVTLSAGEVLFIPVAWWHHLRALDVSISLSFTNFRVPNRFNWYYPGTVE